MSRILGLTLSVGLAAATALDLVASIAAARPFQAPFAPAVQPHPAVVRVNAVGRDSSSHGSGTLVGVVGQHGLVVTNWHVVQDAPGDVSVVFPDGFRSPARVLKVDRDWDLAALLIWRPNVQPVAISVAAPRPGEMLTIAGYGSGQYRAASGRCTQYVAPGMRFPFEMVELSAQAREGDSGGPILNERGELAGVLFGAGRGTTSGSYCGRVRTFLESVLPEVNAAADTWVASHAPAFRPAASPAPSPLPAPPPSQTDVTLQPRIDVAGPIDIAGRIGTPTSLTPRFQGDEPPADSTSPKSQDHAAATAAASTPGQHQPLWSLLVGYTFFERAKSFLAGIGLFVVLLRLSSWMARKPAPLSGRAR